MKYQLEINQKNFDVTIAGVTGDMARVVVNGHSYDVRIKGSGSSGVSGSAPQAVVEQPIAVRPQAAEVPAPSPAPAPAQPVPGRPAASVSTGAVDGEPILAPIPGLILEIKVKVGETVAAGQTVAVMEAMKMENSLVTHVDGVIQDIRVQKGSEVSTGDVILIVG